MLLGSHLSIAGGMHLAVEKAHEYGFDTLAVFVRNQRQWHVPVLKEEAIGLFRNAREKYRIGPVVAHGSYLLNLAGVEPIRARSIDALTADLDRCDRLGIEYLVIHPGSHRDAATGLALIADGLNQVFRRHPLPGAGRGPGARILLETTAGSGSVLGSRFEHLQTVLAALDQPKRAGVCLDTCHVFAAGYDIRSRRGYLNTLREFDAMIGLRHLCAVHLNDSLRELASRVDRHAHIGQGQIGLEGFAHFANDRRLAKVPMVLETPKGLRETDGMDWDLINAQTVRSLVKKRGR